MKDSSKAGKIYLKIAANCVFEIIPNHSEGYYERLLDRADFYSLEFKLKLESYIRNMTSAFREVMTRPIGNIPQDLETILLKSDDPSADLRDLRNLFNSANLTNGYKGEIALEIIRPLHNLWVVKNKEDFFSLVESRERFRFMPLELIGIDRVLWYYQRFLEPFFSVIHLTVDASYIERSYIVLQETFFLARVIRDRETLREALLRLDYGTDKITTAMRDPETISAVAAQIIAENPVLL